MAEYTVETVEPGATFSKTVSDHETWGDTLIDVSASGANAEITALGAGWTVRNVGVRGENNAGTEEFIFFAGDTGGGTATIENIYLGDGDVGTSHGDGEAAIYVAPSHNGTLEVRRAYIANHLDNGLYGSGPGHPDTSMGQGQIHVYDTFSGNNTASNIRLGTDGSFIENCCLWGGPHRGFWQYFEHGEIRNSHIGGMDSPGRAIEVGEPIYDKAGQASVTVIDSQYEGYRLRESSNSIEFEGDVGTNPQRFIPDGCPTSPEEAASGGGGTTPDPSSPVACVRDIVN